MQRRNFLRIAGGGVIASAVASAAGRLHAGQRLPRGGRAGLARRRPRAAGRAALDPELRDPGAAFAQPAVLAGRPEPARRDHALLRPLAPAAADRSVVSPDHDEPRHFPGTARPGGTPQGPARRHRAVPARRVRPRRAGQPAGRAHPARARCPGCGRSSVRAGAGPPHQPRGLRTAAAGRRCLARHRRQHRALALSHRFHRCDPARGAAAPACHRQGSLARRTGHAAHHPGVVPGAARGSARNRAASRRTFDQHANGPGAQRTGPVRPHARRPAPTTQPRPARSAISTRRSTARRPSSGW